MAHRHKHHKEHKAKGGRTEYSAVGSNVMEEAHEKKRGGKVAHMHHKKGHHRMDKRARGGGAGADHHPFSSAGSGLHKFEPHAGHSVKKG